MQKLAKILSTMNLSSFLHTRRGMETSGNIPESPCVGVCTMFEKNICKSELWRNSYLEIFQEG